MFYVVEFDEQIKRLKAIGGKAYVEVISGNDNVHPALTFPCAVYIHPLEQVHGYILPLAHTEGLNIEKNKVEEALRAFGTLYTLDKKELLYHFYSPSLIDLQLLALLGKEQILELPEEPGIFRNTYAKHRAKPWVNTIIPLTKLYERAENNYEYLKPLFDIDEELIESWEFYNETTLKTFFLLERQGLGVTEKFLELHETEHPEYSYENGRIYSYYNLYNTTSRPTNAFNSINFAAIPHKEEHRKAIIPVNGSFVEFDFDGYHLRLLAKEIGYELTEEKAHTQLARLYFGKEELSEDDYQKAKQTNFQAIYGKIPKEYKDLEIFRKLQAYVDTLWSQYQKEGNILCPISKRKYKKGMPDMYPQKLLNYVVQNLETSRNVVVLKELLRLLRNKKSFVALYTYDAILVDMDPEESEELESKILEILGNNKEFPIHVRRGTDYLLDE